VKQHRVWPNMQLKMPLNNRSSPTTVSFCYRSTQHNQHVSFSLFALKTSFVVPFLTIPPS